MFIACDESDTESSFLIGTIWLPEGRVSEVEARVHNFRLQNKFWREVHCHQLKKTGRNLEMYHGFLETIFEVPDLRFSFIIVNKDPKADEEFHDGSYLKRNLVFLYQLISRRYRGWNISTDPYIIFDEMTSDDEEDPPRDEISEARKSIERYIGRRLKCFSPCKSHISSLVQAADLMTGLVAHKWRVDNEGFKPNEAKMALVEVVENRFMQKLSHPTAPTSSPLNIWKHTPKNK